MGITGYGMVELDARATTRTVVEQNDISAKNFVRKAATGWLYDFQFEGDNVDFGKKRHYLTNYANTTWVATKQVLLKKANVTSKYYYVTSKSGKTSGWVWGGYLTRGTNYYTLLSTTNKQLGKTYVYGASGTRAFDCSSFTQYVYQAAANQQMPRTAQAQYHAATKVSSANARRGDLVFFGGSTGSISHVGIYLGNGQMVNAQSRGVITEAVHAPWWNVVGYARPLNLV